MENKRELPKVLVVGINAWREDGTAHTLMDIFRCWDPEKVALVYSRADLPNTDVCKHFFQISESEVMKSVVKPWMKVGREVHHRTRMLKRNMLAIRVRTRKVLRGCRWHVSVSGSLGIGRPRLCDNL